MNHEEPRHGSGDSTEELHEERWTVEGQVDEAASESEPSACEDAPEHTPDASAEASADAPAPEHNGDEAARLKEALLRMRAEMDNREKRMEREMTKARKFALESLLRDLIPVLDSMDQALAAQGDSSDEAMREGMQLTRKLALKALDQHGLQVIDPIGQPFDPSWHEAMTTRPGSGEPDDTVVEVLQKGYSLNERLIRPARVVVARD